MPLIDVKCSACEGVHEVYRSLADWPHTPPCATCGEPTSQVHLPKQVQWTVDPVVVFKAPDGTFRFPGDRDGKSATNYAKMGYERVEIRGAVEMRGFERKMNKAEFAEAERRVERKHQMREEREKRNRSTLRDEMGRMTQRGRDLARAAMARNDAKPQERARDGNFHSEVFSMDRSNRDDSRDSSGRRRRD